MSDIRWSIYIDIEGFSNIYPVNEGRAIRGLCTLAGALYNVGHRAYPDEGERLFIHQFGDGFVVVSDFLELCASRPLAIAIAVMRHMIVEGIATKAAISVGGFGDYFGCYPPDLQAACDANRRVKIGSGLMTILPVMGTALISPVKLSEKQSGAILLLDRDRFSQMPEGVCSRDEDGLTIDWVNADFPLISWITKKADLLDVGSQNTRDLLLRYIDNNSGLSEQWKKNTLDAIGL